MTDTVEVPIGIWTAPDLSALLDKCVDDIREHAERGFAPGEHVARGGP